MASLSTCHLGLWLGWQILLNLVKIKQTWPTVGMKMLIYVTFGTRMVIPRKKTRLCVARKRILEAPVKKF